MNKAKLILASGSPRRKEILENLHFDFDIMIPDTIEDLSRNLPPGQLAMALAREKAVAVRKAVCGSDASKWIAAFDTIVVCGKKVLGKPFDQGAARAMLEQLSGRDHDVITAVALSCPGKPRIVERTVKTRVRFKALSNAEIDFYLGTKEWIGVAGAYRIQERGGFFIKSIFGCYFNVVGLPISAFYDMLCENKYSFF
ncbi:MAG: septum formation protein Maf [Spirochaetales bacterium]|nr:septum formation protein Maf [Spirochaetales bacterium]